MLVLLEASKRVKPAYKVTIAKAAALQDTAAAAQLDLLEKTRCDIIRMLAGETSEYRRYHLGQALQVIDAQIQMGRSQAQALTGMSMRTSMGYGVEMAEHAVGHSSLYGVSPELLNAVVEVTNDQVRAVWSELGTSLKTQVRRATLGITDPYEAMTALARQIKDTKNFRTAEVRAETIIRTEVGRGFSLSNQKRLSQAQEAGLHPLKWWLATRDDRTREEHLEAWRKYRPGGEIGPIPIDQPFIVGGEELMEPLDPAGSAANTINCRCCSVPYMV